MRRRALFDQKQTSLISRGMSVLCQQQTLATAYQKKKDRLEAVSLTFDKLIDQVA
jgi:hypothetical protein